MDKIKFTDLSEHNYNQMKFPKGIIIKLHWRLIFSFSHQQKKRNFFKIMDKKEVKQPIIYPKQYPSYPLSDATPIISRERPLRFITPKYQIPEQKMMEQDYLIKSKTEEKWKSPQNSYVLNVGLIGPVNAGKSQLFGALAHRISAVSAKASTTTDIITGVKSFERQSDEGIKNVQLKYFDTPGLMYKKEGFISRGWKVLSEIDFSLLVVDSAKRFDDIIRQSIKRLEKHRDYPNFMKSLVLNKIDLVDNRRKFDSLIRQIQKYGKFDKIFYVSAKTGYGIKQLEDYLIKMAKQGEWEHTAQTKTTMTELQIYEQMMKQAIFNRSYKQLPHEVDIVCISTSKLSNGKHQIIFDLFVETENQQRMLIGTEGRNINQAIGKFKVLYAKFYSQEAEALCTVKIRNKFRQKFRGKEQILINDFERDDQQKLRVLTQKLQTKRNSGEIRRITDVDTRLKQ